MVDKKPSAGSKGSGKPEDAASSKIPKPLLDLKATEVRSSASAESSKPAPTSALKGSPDWSGDKNKPDANKSGASPASGTAGSSSPPSHSSTGSSTTGASSAASSTTSTSSTGTSTSGGSSTSGSPASGSVKASMASLSTSPVSTSSTTAKPASSAATAGTSSEKSASATGSSSSSVAAAAAKSASSTSAAPKSTDNKSAASSASGSAAKAASAQQRSSGGGFFSTVSHLAAGIIGGGIALFAAEPLERGFGVALTQPPKLPAGIEQRLAALESSQSSADKDSAARQAVARLASKIVAAESRIAELGKLEKQVASLSSEVEKIQSNASSPSAAGETSSGNEAVSGALRARLAKLESALATLSSATSSGGQPSGIAPLAKFSARFADLETSLSTQIGSLRKDLLGELDSRISATTSSTAKAVAGAERLDREVTEIKTDTARLEQRSTVLKTATDKLSATMRAIGEQAAGLKVELDSLKGDLKQELTKVARPGDVQQAIAPVSAKVASIEKNLGSVLASETARKKNAERIVLSLELSNLKRVLDRGAPYSAELADVKKIAGNAIDFGPLEAHKANGVPSAPELTRQFRKVAYQIIHAEDQTKNASRFDKLFAAAKSIVQVRRTDIAPTEKTAEAAVARIENHLKQGDMSSALALAEKLPEQAKAPAKDWMSKLAARAGVDRAIAQIEDQLKASLGSAAPDKKS